jgi:hypothetical protein
MSCVPPDEYAERFKSFIKRFIKTIEISAEES